MGCGSSTSTRPTRVKQEDDTYIADIDLDDNYNEPPKQNVYKSTSGKATTPAIFVTPPVTARKDTQQRSSNNKSSKAPINDVIELETLDDEDFPPIPCRLRKVDIVPDISMFAQIDDHVAQTPKSATASVPELAQYLCRPAKNRLEKVRAIYQWVTRNIEYDVAGFLNLNGAQKKPGDSESVLRNRSSVCNGYGNLFLALCRESSVTAKTISGYAKGYGHKADVPITTDKDPNHDWNVVFLNNEWRLIDCTWDAGNVADNKFHRHEGEFYFLTDPEVFINDHFPYIQNDMAASQKWQLLDNARDLKTFNNLVKMQKHAVKYDLDFITHRDAIITVNKEVIVKVVTRTSPLKNFRGSLHDASGSLQDHCVFAEKEGDTHYCLTVRPQRTGRYTLYLYGNQGETDSLNSLVCYMVDCKTVDKSARSFPVHFGLWGVEENYADFGFDDGVVQKCSFEADTGETEIRLPIKEQVAVLGNLRHSEDENSDDKYVMLEQDQSELVVKVRMDRAGYYTLLLFAKKPNGTLYEKVIQFAIYCKTPVKMFQPFPQVYPLGLKLRVFLREPTTKILPPETDVRFQLASSIVDALTIGPQTFKRGHNNSWDIVLTTPASGEKLTIFGSDKSENKTLKGLYGFEIA